MRAHVNVFMVVAFAACETTTRPPPALPTVKTVTFSETLWGTSISDPYRWMEDLKSDDLRAFFERETRRARAELDNLPDHRQLLSRVSELSADLEQVVNPHSTAHWTFYEKRARGAQTYKLVRRSSSGEEQVVLDPRGASIDWWQPAPDGTRIVVGMSKGGNENAIGTVITSEGATEEQLENVPYPSVAWLPDSTGFFYNRFAGRPVGDPEYYSDRAVFLHVVGTPQTKDREIVGPHATKVSLRRISSPDIQVGTESRYVALTVKDGYTRNFDLYIALRDDVQAGRETWRKIADAKDGIVDFALTGDTLYLVDARDGVNKLYATDAGSGNRASGHAINLPAETVIEELNATRDGTFMTVNHAGEQSILAVGNQGKVTPISLPFTGWLQSISAGHDGSAMVRITGWLRPATIFRIDSAGIATRSELQPAPAISLDNYEVMPWFATAHDGTKIPLTVLRAKGRSVGPVLMHAYGAYQWSEQPHFDVRDLAFLERGGAIAIAHVRGGGEYGASWHEQGQKQNKHNTWEDLLACAEELVRRGVARQGARALEGGSAGGIAVGMAMDTYHHVDPKTHYPRVLLTTGINDVRVAPHNAGKLAARLGTTKDPYVLLNVDFAGGHVSSNTDKAKLDVEVSDDFAFVLDAYRHATH